MENAEQLLTVSEAAKILTLRPGTVRAWCYQRRLLRVRIGKRSVRIPVSEVRRIIREGTDSKMEERT